MLKGEKLVVILGWDYEKLVSVTPNHVSQIESKCLSAILCFIALKTKITGRFKMHLLLLSYVRSKFT